MKTRLYWLATVLLSASIASMCGLFLAAHARLSWITNGLVWLPVVTPTSFFVYVGLPVLTFTWLQVWGLRHVWQISD